MAIVGSLRTLFADSEVHECDAIRESRVETSSLARRLRERALPSRCLLCDDTCDEFHNGAICAPCDDALVRVPDESCPRCRLPSSNGEVCGRCLRYPPQWNRLDARFMYVFPLDRLIVGAKHARHWGVFDWAASAIGEWRFDHDALLIPVPTSNERVEARGYDQSILLAKTLAKRFALRIDTQALVRIRATDAQANRTWVERRRNVRGAFAATRSLSDERVVLIDDVLTTGATLNEAAKAVIEASAASVDALVIARVTPPRARDRVQKFNRVVA